MLIIGLIFLHGFLALLDMILQIYRIFKIEADNVHRIIELEKAQKHVSSVLVETNETILGPDSAGRVQQGTPVTQQPTTPPA